MDGDYRNLLRISVVGAIAFLASLYLDSATSEVFESVRGETLSALFNWVGLVSSKWIVILFLTVVFFVFVGNRKRSKNLTRSVSLTSRAKRVLPLWLTILLSVVVSFILKIGIQRLRPFQQGVVELFSNSLLQADFLTWNFSFPSFQAMLVFSVIPLIHKKYGHVHVFLRAWIVFAVLVALSRIYFGLHFLSDVIAGAMMGLIIGIFIMKFWKN